jgi:hypothetical protein
MQSVLLKVIEALDLLEKRMQKILIGEIDPTRHVLKKGIKEFVFLNYKNGKLIRA